MNIQYSKEDIGRGNCESLDFVLKDENKERRRIELRRRFFMLRSKRSNLEKELERVNLCLLTLESQIKIFFEREKL